MAETLLHLLWEQGSRVIACHRVVSTSMLYTCNPLFCKAVLHINPLLLVLSRQFAKCLVMRYNRHFGRTRLLSDEHASRTRNPKPTASKGCCGPYVALHCHQCILCTLAAMPLKFGVLHTAAQMGVTPRFIKIRWHLFRENICCSFGKWYQRCRFLLMKHIGLAAGHGLVATILPVAMSLHCFLLPV